jgi:trimeric autotransporter adhesin
VGIRTSQSGATRGIAVAVVMAAVVALAPAASATPPAKPALKTWGATGAVRSEVIIGTTLYIGGSFTSVVSPDGLTTVPRRHLAAIDLTTGDLLAWKPTTNGAVLTMATDGTTLFIGGSFTVANGESRAHLAAIDLTGALLPWASGANAAVFALHLRGTTLYVGGAFTTLGGAARGYLGATSTTGDLLPWDPVANDRVKAITTVASGEVVVGGFFTEVGGQGIDHIDGLDPTTGASLSWAYPSSAEVVALITGPDDNVYGAIAGSGGKLRSWTNDGHLRWTNYTDGDVNAVAYFGGQVIAGGHWIYLDDGATYLPRLAAFDPATGLPDTAWRPRLNKQVWAFATDGVSTLAVGGVFTSVGGSAYRRVAVYRT